GRGELRPLARRAARDRAAVPSPASVVILRIVAWTLGALALVVVAINLWFSPHIWGWRDQPVGETAFMAYRMDELRAKSPKAELQYRWVPYDRISNNLQREMVAAEDAKVDGNGV